MRSCLLELLLVVTVSGCSARAAGAPAAWKRVVLVELFTSQGCSSCPPADAFVRDLPALGFGRDKVIPLTFHVDYWDGLGWKDPFADSAFTRRQERYVRSKMLRPPAGQPGLDGLYTPQMIVDGQVHFSGRRREDAFREMARAAERPPLFDLTGEAVVRDAAIDVRIHTARRGGIERDRDWGLVVALVAKKARTVIAHGENAGETLDEAAVVRALSNRIELPGDPRTAMVARLTKPADVSWFDVDVVAFVQSDVTGEIGGTLMLGAAGGPSPERGPGI